MPANAEQAILAAEENLAQATSTVNIDALDGIYADDILMTNVLGEACGKSALMQEARRGAAQRASTKSSGEPIETSYEKEDIKVAVHGDAAVSSYRFVVRMKGPALDVHRRYRTTNVWMRRQGRWQVVAAHTAFVLDPQLAATLAGTAP
jgi:ketosteroid isomerase-like protein